MAQTGIVYMTIADKNYNPKLAFIFLNEVANLFMDEIKNTYGTSSNIDYLSKLETIENQYAFLKFGKQMIRSNRVLDIEKTINRKKKEFRDVNS